jgi:undecaprenyl-phosphate 4-deoxy-4-formamido-L-arabinose transferase
VNDTLQPQPGVSIVVPVYGGTAALPELCERVKRTMDSEGQSFEILLVDDRGQAEAWDAITRLSAQYPEVIGLRLGRNFGQHAATICGMAEARGEWIVTMDDDLEHPPESIPALLAACDEDFPLVYGTFAKRTHASYRNVTSELMRKMLKWTFPDLNEDYCSFRVVHAPLAKELARFDVNRPYIDGMLSWLTSSTRSVDVPHGERRHGDSTYTLGKLIAHASNIFVTFSALPLRLATYTGAALSGASFLSLLYVVYGKLSGNLQSPGYASLMSVVLLACGIQLLILGVLGEYIGRLMGATLRRPMYVVDRNTRRESGRLTPR